MTSNLTHNLKKVVAGVLALIVVGGVLPAADSGVKLIDTAVAASAAGNMTESIEEKTDSETVGSSEAHIHSFTYTTGTGDAANSITAKCADDCPDGFYRPCTLSLNAPEDLTYDGTPKEAAITGNPGHAGLPGEVVYYKSAGKGSTVPSGASLSGAPADAGYYVAQFTWGTATASKAFTITADLFDAEVTVDTSEKSVSVTIDGRNVPSDAYNLIFFTYEKSETGEKYTRVGNDYPAEPGVYVATVSTKDNGSYINGKRSEPFYVGTELDFETMKQVSGWFSIDVDDDGNVWQFTRAAMAIQGEKAHSGNVVIVSYSWINDTALNTDNWAISPEFVVYENGSLELWAKCDANYPENFRVYAIRKSDADMEDFEVDAWTPVSDNITATGEWTKYSFDLSDFAGETVFIALRHNDTDKDYLLIDDVTLPGKIQEKIDLSDAVITVDADERTVTVTLGDEEVPEEQYELYFFSCEQTEDEMVFDFVGQDFPTAPGTYMVNVSPVLGGDYCSVIRSDLFKVYKDFSEAEVTVDADNKTVTVKIGDEVIPSDQYSVAYGPNAPQSTDEFPTAPGTYYAYVTADTANSDYQGTAVSAPFTIADKNAISSTRVKLTGVSSDSSGTLTVNWAPDENADGYEILLWNSRRMGYRTGISRFDVDDAESSITIDGLIPGGRYFVKVRAYKLVDGRRVYGRFSRTGFATVMKPYYGFGFGYGFGNGFGYGYGYGTGFNNYRKNPWNFGYGMSPFNYTASWGFGYGFGSPYLAANSFRPSIFPSFFFRF